MTPSALAARLVETLEEPEMLPEYPETILTADEETWSVLVRASFCGDDLYLQDQEDGEALLLSPEQVKQLRDYLNKLEIA